MYTHMRKSMMIIDDLMVCHQLPSCLPKPPLTRVTRFANPRAVDDVDDVDETSITLWGHPAFPSKGGE